MPIIPGDIPFNRLYEKETFLAIKQDRGISSTVFSFSYNNYDLQRVQS
jgi:hypothetical protein